MRLPDIGADVLKHLLERRIVDYRRGVGVNFCFRISGLELSLRVREGIFASREDDNMSGVRGGEGASASEADTGGAAGDKDDFAGAG